MKAIWNVIKWIGVFLWTLPTNIIGLIFGLGFCVARGSWVLLRSVVVPAGWRLEGKKIWFFSYDPKWFYGTSFQCGSFIFMRREGAEIGHPDYPNGYIEAWSLLHEYGHTRDAQRWGVLWSFVWMYYLAQILVTLLFTRPVLDKFSAEKLFTDSTHHYPSDANDGAGSGYRIAVQDRVYFAIPHERRANTFGRVKLEDRSDPRIKNKVIAL